LGISSPPIWIRKVTPPNSPKIIKVVSGDRKITLTWLKNSEQDILEYKVFRAENSNIARDLRLMKSLDLEFVTNENTISIEDTKIIASRKFYYRIIAIDEQANISKPSKIIPAQCCELTPPDPPEFTNINRSADGTIITLEWVAPNPYKCLLKRKTESERIEIDISTWLESISYDEDSERFEYRFQEVNLVPETRYIYHIVGLSYSGCKIKSEERSV